MTRDELQTHIFTWVMGRTIETAHVNRRLGLLRIKFAADVTLLVRLASYRGVIHQHRTVDMRAVMSVNVHPQACTLSLGLSEPKPSLRAMQSIERPSSQFVMFLNMGVKTPVRIFSGSGEDVTTQFGPYHAERVREADEGRTAYEHSWSPGGGFQTRQKARRGETATFIIHDEAEDATVFGTATPHGPTYVAVELDEHERAIIEAFKAGLISAEDAGRYLDEIEQRRKRR